MEAAKKTKLPLTVTIITMNEENNILRCIDSVVDWVDEVVVVDSGSTDRTQELVEARGAHFFPQAWLGFGQQKQMAVDHARNQWILSLDADEKVSKMLKQELFMRWDKLNPKIGYKMPRLSYFLGRWIQYGGWYPDFQLRLFHKKHSNWSTAKIHEKVRSPIEEKLSHPIYHYVFKDVGHQIQTNNKYSGLLAEKDFESHKYFSWIKLVVKPWFKFIECYFIKRGFMDRGPGFIIAVNAAHSYFLRMIKLGELEKKFKPSRKKKHE